MEQGSSSLISDAPGINGHDDMVQKIARWWAEDNRHRLPPGALEPHVTERMVRAAFAACACQSGLHAAGPAAPEPQMLARFCVCVQLGAVSSADSEMEGLLTHTPTPGSTPLTLVAGLPGAG
jgi:hypothetical protein